MLLQSARCIPWPYSGVRIRSFSSKKRCQSIGISLSAPNSSYLEIERKFSVTKRLESLFAETKSRGQSIYHRPEILNGPADSLLLSNFREITFTDQYFDRADVLSSKGIWIRKRTTHRSSQPPVARAQDQILNAPIRMDWEVKQITGGDFLNSTMIEDKGEEKAVELWKQHFATDRIGLDDTVAEICTVRHIVRLDDLSSRSKEEKLAVIDYCTAATQARDDSGEDGGFSHNIGEVELCAPLIHGVKHEEDLLAVLGDWMERYQVLFPTRPKPVGKLSAFLAWKHRAGVNT